METQVKQKVLAVVDDLFFTVKIHDAAKRAGIAIEFVKSEHDLMEKAKLGPSLVIIDLNCKAVQPLELITKLKGDASLRHLRLVSYLSHVQGELKVAAQQAGCDMVLARSTFSQNLQQIIQQQSAVR